jgi:hypothetical protein
MTVQELIDQLTELKNEGFGNTELVLSITDHTDWTYNFNFPGFNISNVYDEEFDSDTDYGVCEVSI